MKHTELPFEVTSDNGLVYINDGFDMSVCDLYHMADGKPYLKLNAEANAAFIVKACNSHYKLLSVLKEIIEFSDYEQLSNLPKGLVKLIEVEAREAIKEAENG